jgi:hypothetical protein
VLTLAVNLPSSMLNIASRAIPPFDDGLAALVVDGGFEDFESSAPTEQRNKLAVFLKSQKADPVAAEIEFDAHVPRFEMARG